MKFEGMNPAPPVTSTRLVTARPRPNTGEPMVPPWAPSSTDLAGLAPTGLPPGQARLRRRAPRCAPSTMRISSSKLLRDRVQGPPFHLSLDSAQVLAHEREDESLHAEHEHDSRAAEERPGEVRVLDPEDHAVDPEPERRERA